MAVELEQLDREAAMMLYAAGELEPAAREAFELRLSGEPQLAADLEQLRAAQGSIAAALQHADAQQRLPVNEGVAVRRVSRSINAWLAARTVAAMPPVKKPWPMPWWSYPAAAAACLIVGFLVWSSRQEVGPMPAPEMVKSHFEDVHADNVELADNLETWFDPARIELAESTATEQPQDDGAFFLTPEETQ